MSKWVRAAIWAAGSCVVWCPVCVCLTGGGAWWVCACAVGLITVTLGSGYTTWTVFSNLLRHGPQSYPLFARCFSILERVVERGHIHTSPVQELGRSSKIIGVKQSLGGSGLHVGSSSSSSLEPVLQEMVVTAGCVHSILILPWYSRVSPDARFSYQIKDILEEMLTSMCNRVRESGNLTRIGSGIIQIYLQHYRQYYRALKKVSKKHKDAESLSKVGPQEVPAKYKPLHPALKNPEATKLYYRKLAQILLQHYLPEDVTRCDLILISLRDLFAQNVLQAFVDLICDTQWLNTTLVEILSGVGEDLLGRNGEGMKKDINSRNESTQVKTSVEGLVSVHQTAGGDKVSSSNLLASIEEETASDLQKLHPESTLPIQKSILYEFCPPGTQSSKENLEEKKFENAKALVEYVRSSSLEKKENSEEEDYRSVSSALGTLISTTAGPLLPDSSSPPLYQPLVSKMWESPVEDKSFIDTAPIKLRKNSPFSRNVVEGMKEEDYKLMYSNNKNEVVSPMTASSPASEAECSLLPKEGSSEGIEIKIEDSEFVSNDDTEKSDSAPSHVVLPRSKSCGNLISKEKSANLSVETKPLHASLCELDDPSDKDTESKWRKTASLSLGDDSSGNRKEKRHLIKMPSFDKNDGTDEASIERNKLNTAETRSFKDTDCSEAVQIKQSYVAQDSPSSEPLQSPDTSTTDVEPPNTLEIPTSPSINNAGFGWDNPDLSPIYEESEDLASSIAKLRSLLSERESQHSLGSLSSYGSSESEPKSAQSDPGRYSLEKSRFTFTHKDSSGSLASVKSVSSLESCGNGITDEDLLEAAEIPLDGRVFLSVSVPSTEVHTEPGGAQYTLYTIQYDAIYLCESPATVSTVSDGVEEISSEPAVVSEPRMVLQTNCVKRRFREFLTLHAALEEDSRLRTAIKGVKGPNKWLNLPFSKLDSTTIATRKQFLEKYLQSVIQRPEVNISTPVKEFLAYGLDSSVSFIKKPLELHVPRLDKLLAKTVSGVFHSLKTALPSFESSDSQPQGGTETIGNVSVMSGGSGGDGMLKSKSGGGVLNERNKLAAFLSISNKAEYELKLDITAEEEECQIEEALVIEVSGANKSELVDTAYEARENRSLLSPSAYSPTQYQQEHQHSVVVGRNDSVVGSGKMSSSPFGSPSHHLPPPGPRSQGDGCEINTVLLRDNHQDSLNEEEAGGSWEDWPLSVGLLDAVVEVLSPYDHPLTHQPCITLLTLTLAKITHKWLQSELERLFSESNTVEYIQSLREVILMPPQVGSPSPSPEDIAKSRVQLQDALREFIPGVLQVTLGAELTNHAVTRMVDSIQYPPVTADLALHLLDLVVTHLLPISPSTP